MRARSARGDPLELGEIVDVGDATRCGPAARGDPLERGEIVDVGDATRCGRAAPADTLRFPLSRFSTFQIIPNSLRHNPFTISDLPFTFHDSQIRFHHRHTLYIIARLFE